MKIKKHDDKMNLTLYGETQRDDGGVAPIVGLEAVRFWIFGRERQQDLLMDWVWMSKSQKSRVTKVSGLKN